MKDINRNYVTVCDMMQPTYTTFSTSDLLSSHYSNSFLKHVVLMTYLEMSEINQSILPIYLCDASHFYQLLNL